MILRSNGIKRGISLTVIAISLLLIVFLWSDIKQAAVSLSPTEQVNAAPMAGSVREVLKVNSSLLPKAVKRDKLKPRDNTAEELQALGHMEKVLENEKLALYINRETAETAVTIKEQKYTWFSNPQGREQDALASPLYKSELSSQIILSYYNDKGQLNRMNSYTESTVKKQFVIDASAEQLKITYTFGNAPQGNDSIPKVISKERMETAILSKIADTAERDRFMARYKLDEAAQVYRVRKLQDYVAEEMRDLLQTIGYTAEDARSDEGIEQGEAVVEKERVQFTVPLIYRLDGEQLTVSVPLAELSYTKSYPAAFIEVLPHFGAAGLDSQGYMLVPDGSGALIHLNNRKWNAEPYVMPIYGEDDTFNVKEKWQQNEKARLPIFGLMADQRAWIGMIEQGDALASVMADISGRNHNYNSAASRFRIVAMDYYTLTSGTKSSSVPMFEENPYQGDLAIRYGFTTGDRANYAGMGEVYRSFLEDKKGMRKLEKAEVPFMLELKGDIPIQRSFLGIPYESDIALTSFTEAEQIIGLLQDNGISRIDLRYVGWFNGGIRHKSPDSIRIDSVLGGASGFKQLMDYSSKGVTIYPDTALMQQYYRSRDAAYFLTQDKARVYKYDPVMKQQDNAVRDYLLLTPNKLLDKTSAFLDDYKEWNTGALSLRDLGEMVYSDFDPSQAVSRQGALLQATTAAEELHKQVPKLMFNGGNAYGLPYAAAVINAPERSSRMNMTDEDVPLYQIVLHGYVDLAGAPFNQGGAVHDRTALLRAAETGMNVFVDWFYADAATVKETDYDQYMSNHYQIWFEQAVSQYKELYELSSLTREQPITGHRKLAEGVTWTQYANGITVVVNYNDSAVQMDDITIEGLSFAIGTGGDTR
ncbi:DUF5696 domain-containing protein [Paenibacillus marinisediminis]